MYLPNSSTVALSPHPFSLQFAKSWLHFTGSCNHIGKGQWYAVKISFKFLANQYMISLKYQFKSYLRTKRFLGLILFTTIISIGITALMLHDEYSMLKAGTPLFYFYNYLSGFSADLVVIIGAFFGGDIISTDTGTNAAYYTLVQPVRRSILLCMQ